MDRWLYQARAEPPLAAVDPPPIDWAGVPTVPIWPRRSAPPLSPQFLGNPADWAPVDGWAQPLDVPMLRRPGVLPAESLLVLQEEPADWAPVDGWAQPLDVPMPRRPGVLPLAPPQFLGEPTDWPAPEDITLDKWWGPFSDPIRRPPPFPEGGAFYVTAPSLIPYSPWQFPFPAADNPIPRANLWRPRPHDLVDPSIFRGRFFLDARGKYRVFNAAGYRFYRSSVAPPAETDVPFATSATLPATPSDTYGDGTWYLSVSYFNGVLDSGFLPIGPAGETFLVIEIDSGEALGDRPGGPLDWRLELRPAGVVRVVGLYCETGNLRATEWAIAYTTDGSTPAIDTPTLTVAMETTGLAILQEDLPAQAHGTTLKVRLQTRRNDGTEDVPIWIYSTDSTVLTAAADAVGPTAPLGLDRWPGSLEEG